METLHTFTRAADAIDYRRTRGLGGWIWRAADGSAVIFPPTWTPSRIFAHPLAAGSGHLIGS